MYFREKSIQEGDVVGSRSGDELNNLSGMCVSSSEQYPQHSQFNSSTYPNLTISEEDKVFGIYS